jgi:hypothetical protein
LERLCLLYDFDPAGFELPISKTLIASRLRMELETFSRALKKLSAHGITVTGTHVAFTDRGKVGRFVCDACSMREECQTHALLHGISEKIREFGT